MHHAASLRASYVRFLEAVDSLLSASIRGAYAHTLEPAAQEVRRRVISSLLAEATTVRVCDANESLGTDDRLRLMNELEGFLDEQAQAEIDREWQLDLARMIVRDLRASPAQWPLSTLHDLANLDSLLALGQQDSHQWFYTVELQAGQVTRTAPPANASRPLEAEIC